MRLISFLLLVLSLSCSKPIKLNQKPKTKILIGLVVDQMRGDYLERFWDDFSEEGFKRLVNDGIYCSNTNYDYKPTYTAPGHASIFSGTNPSSHGIVANSWYSRKDSSKVYCVSEKQADGSYFYSPRRLTSETIGDVIKSKNGKVYGVSIKDRSAILPAGKNADAAYWFDGESGGWISSSYYSTINDSLLKEFNNRKNIDQYLSSNWTLSLSEDNYSESYKDSSEYEGNLTKNGKNTFPYNIQEAFEELGFDILKTIPSGNQMTADFALKLIETEKLGLDSILDFLAISFSVTDYIGHKYGVNSREVHDCYVKLDLTIAALLRQFDNQFGENSYLLFLTSDHGAAENPNYLKAKGELSGFLDDKKLIKNLEFALNEYFGNQKWIDAFTNLNIYLNHQALEESNLSLKEVDTFIKNHFSKIKGIRSVFNPLLDTVSDKLEQACLEGFNKNSSGEFILIENSNWIDDYYQTGTTHGSAYEYDTYVPLMLYGVGLNSKEIERSVFVRDLVPTLCHMLSIRSPEKTSGVLIHEVLE